VVVDGAVGDVLDALQALAVQGGGKEEDVVAYVNNFVVAIACDLLERVGHGRVGVVAYGALAGQDDRMDRIPAIAFGVARCRGDALCAGKRQTQDKGRAYTASQRSPELENTSWIMRCDRLPVTAALSLVTDVPINSRIRVHLKRGSRFFGRMLSAAG